MNFYFEHSEEELDKAFRLGIKLSELSSYELRNARNCQRSVSD